MGHGRDGVRVPPVGGAGGSGAGGAGGKIYLEELSTIVLVVSSIAKLQN